MRGRLGAPEGFWSGVLTCRRGPAEEDGVGHEHEKHRRVRGDVVRDGVLKALLTTATAGPIATTKLGTYSARQTCDQQFI